MSSVRTLRARISFAVMVIVALFGVFVFRLVDLQIVQAKDLNAASLSQRSDVRTTFGNRGSIVDANGVVLADSVLRYVVTASPRYATAFTRTTDAVTGTKIEVSVAEAANELATATGQPAASILTALTQDTTSDYAVVAKSIDVDAYNAVRALNIPYLYYEAQQARTYPNGSVAGNIVGFVGSDGQAQAGTELKENSCLAGTNGIESAQTGEDGVRLPGSTVETQSAVNGGDVVLTLNSDLQYFAQQTLAQRVQQVGGESGTVVVTEVKTGKVLVAAEYPTVDPNNVDGTAAEFRGSQIFTSTFEPGSTFKAFTAAALVDSGAATPYTHVLAPYMYAAPGGAVIHDAGVHADTRWTLTGVLMDSSNTGMSILSEAMPAQQRWDYMKKFGLGSDTEVKFPGEESGDLKDPNNLDNQTLYNTTFGQGLTVTAMQMASIYQTIANGGVRMPVQLIAGCRAADGTMTEVPAGAGQQIISKMAADETVSMLESVVTEGYASSSLQVPGYRVSAKTGTAEMSDGNGAYGSQHLTSLAGMAPSDDPQYVVSVTVAKPVTITSALAAAPVFQKVLSQVLKTYRVQPSTLPDPKLPTTY